MWRQPEHLPVSTNPSRSLIGWGLILAALALSLAGAAQAAETVPSFFNSTETRSKNLKPFKKWTNAVKRYTKEVAIKKKGDCKSTKFNKCHYKEWEKFLKSVTKKDPMTQVREVNRVMNKAKYITDIVNWGKKDYWATPGEFLAKFGDCEDYAIAKYMSLKLLGFKDEQMRVVAVKDLNLKIGHAVLVVYLDSKIFVLDNQIKNVVEEKVIRHYKPVYSLNENFWWRHR